MKGSGEGASIDRQGTADKGPLTDEVQRLLTERVGLRLAESDRPRVEKILQDRASGNYGSLAAFCSSLSEPQLAREMESIAAQLTPGETYFFRDHGQFDLLRFKLLPEMIQARRRRKALRIWSAGCATGEEAYSLAMLVDMTLPDRRDWQVSIIGSDLNEDFLNRARRGRYGRWSFRRVPPVLLQRYFRKEGEEMVLRDDIRRMVSFQRNNLVANSLPDTLIRDMDFILCRNVLIYLQPEAVGTVAGKLSACLAEGGYLITGHTELMGIALRGLCSRLFPEGVVYQRVMDKPPAASPAQSPIPAVRPEAPPPAKSPHQPDEKPPYGALLEAARSLADRGEYEAAITVTRKALDADPLAPSPHFLLAQLAQLQGDYQEAEAQLNRTLYLAPDFIAAHLELAALHERTGRAERALGRRRAALALLQRLPSEARVEPFEATAGQLATWLIQTEIL